MSLVISKVSVIFATYLGGIGNSELKILIKLDIVPSILSTHQDLQSTEVLRVRVDLSLYIHNLLKIVGN